MRKIWPRLGENRGSRLEDIRGCRRSYIGRRKFRNKPLNDFSSNEADAQFPRKVAFQFLRRFDEVGLLEAKWTYKGHSSKICAFSAIPSGSRLRRLRGEGNGIEAMQIQFASAAFTDLTCHSGSLPEGAAIMSNRELLCRTRPGGRFSS
jgi:hypothetical protein